MSLSKIEMKKLYRAFFDPADAKWLMLKPPLQNIHVRGIANQLFSINTTEQLNF